MFKLKDNRNYCANIVKIKNTISLDNYDNINGTKIFGDHVLINKNINVVDI